MSIESILYQSLGECTGLEVFQVPYEGCRDNADHVTFQILNMNQQGRIHLIPHDGEDGPEYLAHVTNLVSVQVDAYGYQGYNNLLKFLCCLPSNEWHDIAGCELALASPSSGITNTTFLNDREQQHRHTLRVDFNWFTTISHNIDLITKWIILGNNMGECNGGVVTVSGAQQAMAGGGMEFVTTTGNAAARVGKIYLINNTAPAVVMAPQSASDGDTFCIVDANANSGDHNITVDFSASNFYGSPGSFILNCDGASQCFTWASDTGSWFKTS